VIFLPFLELLLVAYIFRYLSPHGLETQHIPASKITWTSKAETETMANITKEKLIKILGSLLATDADLDFMMQFKKAEIETLVACIRDRVERTGKWIMNIS